MTRQRRRGVVPEARQLLGRFMRCGVGNMYKTSEKLAPAGEREDEKSCMRDSPRSPRLEQHVPILVEKTISMKLGRHDYAEGKRLGETGRMALRAA